jgi:hypothetical protein
VRGIRARPIGHQQGVIGADVRADRFHLLQQRCRSLRPRVEASGQATTAAAADDLGRLRSIVHAPFHFSAARACSGNLASRATSHHVATRRNTVQHSAPSTTQCTIDKLWPPRPDGPKRREMKAPDRRTLNSSGTDDAKANGHTQPPATTSHIDGS